MRPASLAAFACCSLLLLPVPSGAGGPKPKPPAPRTEPLVNPNLEPPDYLSPLARQLLRRRMERHGRDTALLFQAVVLLQRRAVVELARDLFNEPRIVRPLAGERDDLNAALPERFFVLQDELRDRARDLEKAALSGTDADLADRFGHLTRTCVACHSTYLTGDKPQ